VPLPGVLLFAMRGMCRGVRAEVIGERIRAGIRSMLAEAQRELFGVFGGAAIAIRRIRGDIRKVKDK